MFVRVIHIVECKHKHQYQYIYFYIAMYFFEEAGYGEEIIGFRDY